MSRLLLVAALLLGGCTDAPDSRPSDAQPSDPTCSPLFDGTSFDGWTALGDAEFSIETDADGAPMIVGTAVYGIPNSFLRTNAEYDDFDLSLSFKVDSGFNSGVQFRSAVADDTVRFAHHQEGRGRVREQVTRPGTVYGYQADIDPTPRGWTLNIYEESARGWLQTFAQEPVLHQIDPATWHDVRIRAKGDSINTWLDDAPVANLVDDRSASGFIALQVHAVYEPDHAGRTVQFKNITLCTP